MARPTPEALSRRERQIMEILYRLGSASAAEVQENLLAAPSYSAVRAHLRILEDKGHVRHHQEGPRYIFQPTVPRDKVRRNALKGLLRNFFDGSREEVVAALLDLSDSELSADELERMADLIEQARKEGR